MSINYKSVVGGVMGNEVPGLIQSLDSGATEPVDTQNPSISGVPDL
jgi:hypothetical protein